jgi:non-specific serine/threonine protein kinase
MTWKDKIEQLAALLEKIPHPQSFDGNNGVYQPYFIIEMRPANWEIIPFAHYTRMDGYEGKEVRLNYQVIETQKVNINQDELNLLSYLLSFNHYDTRRLFSYGQPVGFLLDWLRGSPLKIRISQNKELRTIDYGDDSGTIALGIFKDQDYYSLKPIIVFSEYTLVLEGDVEVLTANPIYILNNNKLFRVESRMSASFWTNFFRLQQTIQIPSEEIKDFINSFISKILPALDWKSLEEHLELNVLPFKRTKIYLSERGGQLHIDVKFLYRSHEFPAHPVTEKSIVSRGKHLFIVQRDAKKELEIRKKLHEQGLLYIQHRWQVDPQYQILDWIRLKIPELERDSFDIIGVKNLKRYLFIKGVPRLNINIQSSNNAFKLKYGVLLDNEKLEIKSFKTLLEQNKNYLKLPNGANVYFGESIIKKLHDFLDFIGQDSSFGYEHFSAAAFPLVEELTRFADELSVDEYYNKWKEKYQNIYNVQHVHLKNGFNGTLRDYQKTGLDWLYYLYQFNFGGILADDMGLGKTIQVIALIHKLKTDHEITGPVLISVPLTVLSNWENAIGRFAPKLRIMQYQGSKTERERLSEEFHNFDIILVSYGIILQDNTVLSSLVWEYIILDESQKIKNPQTKTYHAIQKLKAKNRLCLTGTPVENSINDLWAQFNFLNSGMFGTQKKFEYRFSANHNVAGSHLDLLKKIIHPFVLRRRKEDVLSELPERTEIVQFIEMTETQKKVYQELLKKYRDQIFDQIKVKGIQKTRLKILEALTYLRQIACHPNILDENVDLMDSGKFLLLEEMLEEIIEEGHKVLVFSQFVRFLRLARKLLDNRGWQYEYLDGTIRKRAPRINNFQNNPEIKIFLISLKAGGLGLNLTAADYVIHLDPWWNPAVEKQASDRVHRIGQKNRVFVYKYIIKSSVEERIIHLQEQKRELSENLITSDTSLIRKLDINDLKLIFQELH